MTGAKYLFYTLDEYVKHVVKLGVVNKVEVEGEGSILIKMIDGVQKLIHDVKYVPILAHNLLSIVQLTSSGYEVVFGKDVCRIINEATGEQLLVIQKNNNNLYLV